MKTTLVTFLFLCTVAANAQDYLISFAGTGESNSVGAVLVENLMKGTTMQLKGDDILHLTGLTGIELPETGTSEGIKIYPNPVSEKSMIEIYPPVPGNATVTVNEITGKQIFQSDYYLENFKQEFRLTGLSKGLYLITIKGADYILSGKLISSSRSAGNVKIERISNNAPPLIKAKSGITNKGVNATIVMDYSAGDRLKFTGTSGIYSTVITDIPESDKTITFNFVACTDGEGNNYSVIKIGSQTWTEGNIITTKFADGTSIPMITDSAAWSNTSTPAFCYYNNDKTTYGDIYGPLYNWYTIVDGKGFCPAGWHIPADAEWTALIDFLGGEDVAGGNLKETGTIHWKFPNTGATDLVGFTALPAGRRHENGIFYFVGDYVRYWTIDEYDYLRAWTRRLFYDSASVERSYRHKGYGLSAKCLKD